MITCPKCSKDNQDHYKFCLGCGAELPRDAAPKPFSPQTPPQGMKAAAAQASAPPPPAPPPPAPPPPVVPPIAAAPPAQPELPLEVLSAPPVGQTEPVVPLPEDRDERAKTLIDARNRRMQTMLRQQNQRTAH